GKDAVRAIRDPASAPTDSATFAAGPSWQNANVRRNAARLFAVSHPDGRVDWLVASGPIAAIESPEMPHAEPGALLLTDESGARGRVVAEMVGYGGWLLRPAENVTGDAGRRAQTVLGTCSPAESRCGRRGGPAANAR